MNHLKTHQTNPTIAQYCPVQSNTSTAQYSQVQPIPEPDPNFLVKPDPNPTRSQKALLVEPWLRCYRENTIAYGIVGFFQNLTNFHNLTKLYIHEKISQF